MMRMDYVNALLDRYSAIPKEDLKDVRRIEESDCPIGLNVGDIVPPTVPFVGKNYDESRVLVYASAENFNSDLHHLKNCARLKDRHRWQFDEEADENGYPNVFCQPFTDGSLVNVAAYICMRKKIGGIDYATPRSFLDSIAFGNFSKFSKKYTGTNSDPRSYKFLSQSLRYIEADLEVLKPRIVILPVTKYEIIIRKPQGQEIFKQSGAEIIKIFQANSQVVNANWKEFSKKENYYIKRKEEFADIDRWGDDASFPKKQKNFKYIYAHIDEKI